jgi:hypothetical protein
MVTWRGERAKLLGRGLGLVFQFVPIFLGAKVGVLRVVAKLAGFLRSTPLGRLAMFTRGPTYPRQLGDGRLYTQNTPNGETMANAKESALKAMQIDGAVGVAIVDSGSGMMLGAQGGGPIDLELAAAGNTEVVRAKRKTMSALNLNDTIEDILITLGNQYHIIRPLHSNDALFVYLVLDKSKGNLAMARHQLAAIEKDLVI